MSHEENCVFCKIINGDIPSAKVYEDDVVFAFLDLSQITKGHTLIIPKTHTKNIYEVDDVLAAELFSRVPKISRAIKQVFNPQGMNVLNNAEQFAGQSVFHLHLHLIPRYDENDGYNPNWVTHEDDYSNEDRAAIAKAISDHI